MVRMRGPEPGRHAALGLFLLATARGEGVQKFGTDRDAYLASLAPLLGFAIVAGGLRIWLGEVTLGALFLLVAVCGLLAPPVIADLFCRWWRRRALWARYATVLNWSQWLMAVLLAALLLIADLLAGHPLPPDVAVLGAFAILAAYGLWFHWFVARHALDLSRVRALLVAIAVTIGTGVLIQAPLSITHAMFGTVLPAAHPARAPAPAPAGPSTPAKGSHG